MLDDVSVHERYIELTKHYQKQIEIDQEIDVTKRMIEALRPLSVYVPKFRELGDKLSRKDTLLAAAEWRIKKDSADVLAEIISTLTSKVTTAIGEIASVEAEKTRLENELGTLLDSEPAKRSRDLTERANTVNKRRQTVQDASRRLRDDIQNIGKIAFPSNAGDFAEMLKQLETIVTDADAGEESRGSEVFQAATNHERLKAKLSELEEEIKEVRDSGSSLPPKDLQARAMIASALGLKNTDLPYAGELVDVASSESEWRVALEKLLRTYARRMLVPDTHMTRVLAFVNATRFEKHRVRLERVPAKSPVFTMSSSDARSACSKLRVKPNHPFSNWLTNELKSKFDYACFKSVTDYERHRGAALTVEGLVKGGNGDYHEKRDDIEIASARDHFLGWNNEEKLRALGLERARLHESISSAADGVLAARQKNESLKRRRDAAKSVLDSVKNFESVDMGSVNADLASIEKERALLAKSDPEAANVEQSIQKLVARIGEKETQITDLIGGKGGDEELIRQHQKEVSEIEDWEETNKKPRDEDLVEVAIFFTPIPAEARQIGKWGTIVERAVRKHFDEIGEKHGALALEIKGVMSGYLITFPNERKTLNDIITAADAFLERLRELEDEKLHELQERFREHLKDNLALHVSQLKSLLQTEVGKSKRRIEDINKILATISWEDHRVTQIFPRQNSDADIKRFEELLNGASAPLLAPTDSEKVNAFGAVKDLIKFLESEVTRKLVLDARNWLLFAVAWPDQSIEDVTERRRTSNARENTDGLSGGQKNKLSVTLLASALAFQYDITGVNARPGTFRTVLIDEAFAKLDSENARYALELFKQFDFQLVLVHPLDGTVRVAEDYVHGFLLATIREGKFSNLTPVSMEDFKRLVDEAAQEQPSQS
ncbi:MAG: SbcC/MukB-like Walker B domain-containing protein [Opitutus sp.]